MNPFAWILLTLPVYLLVHGRLVAYLKLATPSSSTSNGTVGATAISNSSSGSTAANVATSGFDADLAGLISNSPASSSSSITGTTATAVAN